MIARLNGILVETSTMQCVINVQGVGYRVTVPLNTFYELPEIGQPTLLHIHTYVRDDAINLYGFHTQEERVVFQMMISVSGIGPKLAINILSGITAREMVKAVMEENIKRLTGIPGVGKKTAERVILELKDKMAKLGGESRPGGVIEDRNEDRVKDDALSALVNLGYKGSAVKDVVDRIVREATDVPSLDQLLKQALRILAG
jgi:Holliday junction DNA helicase RuvA